MNVKILIAGRKDKRTLMQNIAISTALDIRTNIARTNGPIATTAKKRIPYIKVIVKA